MFNLLEFLFPKDNKTLELEKLTVAEILDILPTADIVGDKYTLALFDYQHPMTKEIVWAIKYGGNRVMAGKIGDILFDHIQDELGELSLSQNWSDLTLIPVPISDRRRFERGWNQAELLCEEIKKHDMRKNFKYLPRQLAKIRHTESQTKTASRNERLKNLEFTMRVNNPDKVNGRCVVLVDDVTTTGATFQEARRVLKEAGAKRVLCIAVAH